jgi:hypothetical protein
MRHITNGLVCLVLALAALAGGLYLFPSWAAAVGLDFWNIPATLDAMARTAALDERIEVELESVRRRNAAKEEVTGEAAAGRLTLLEAAARFRDLDAAASDDYRRGWRRSLPAASDEERYCRAVLAHVKELVRDRPDGIRVLDRLKAELDRALARGDVRLPD